MQKYISVIVRGLRKVKWALLGLIPLGYVSEVTAAVLRPLREHKQEQRLLSVVGGKIPEVSSTSRAGARYPAEARYKVAVIGAGSMGGHQCVGLQTLPQVEIAAVVDRNPVALERLRQYAHLTETRSYTSVEALFKAEKVDMVSIATNTTTHLSVARLAVEAGVRSIIVEKPIGNSVGAARDLARLCADRNVKLAVNHGRRWSKDYAAIKRCLDHGYIGSLRSIYAVCPGGLGMMGVHFFDLMAYLADSPIAWVIGSLDPSNRLLGQGPQFKDPGGYALMGMQNGVRGFLDNSEDLVRKEFFLVLKGNAGRIEVDEKLREWHMDSSALGRRTFEFTDTTQVPVYFAKVVSQMLSDKPPSCGPTEGIGALEAIIATHLSSCRGNVRISLPLEGKDAEMEFPFP